MRSATSARCIAAASGCFAASSLGPLRWGSSPSLGAFCTGVAAGGFFCSVAFLSDSGLAAFWSADSVFFSSGFGAGTAAFWTGTSLSFSSTGFSASCPFSRTFSAFWAAGVGSGFFSWGLAGASAFCTDAGFSFFSGSAVFAAFCTAGAGFFSSTFFSSGFVARCPTPGPPGCTSAMLSGATRPPEVIWCATCSACCSYGSPTSLMATLRCTPPSASGAAGSSAEPRWREGRALQRWLRGGALALRLVPLSALQCAVSVAHAISSRNPRRPAAPSGGGGLAHAGSDAPAFRCSTWIAETRSLCSNERPASSASRLA